MRNGDTGTWGGAPLIALIGALAGIGLLAVAAALVSAATCWD